MNDAVLKLEAEALNAFLARAFPEAGPQLPRVVEAELGRRIATVEVLVWSESRQRAAAKATVAYAIP